MSTDIFEPNDTIGTATDTDMLLTVSGGGFHDPLSGHVATGSTDAADWYRYDVATTVREVAFQLNHIFLPSNHVLDQGGVYGVTDRASINGAGAFAGSQLIVESRLGFNAYGAEVGNLLHRAAELALGISAEYQASLSNGVNDLPLWADFDLIGDVIDTFDVIFERDGVNVQPRSVAASLRSLVTQNSGGGSGHHAEILEIARGLESYADRWETPRYFQNTGSGPGFTEISHFGVGEPSVTWSVAAGGDAAGFVAISGYSLTQDGVRGETKYVGDLYVKSGIGTPGDDKLVAGGFGTTLNGLGGNDRLTGGKGADILIGGTGSDTLLGGSGNDTFHVDSTSDIIMEVSGGGRDKVVSSVSWTLTQQTEDLTLTGSASKGTGNELDNVITGNAKNNSLIGATGNDWLIGSAGGDKLDGGDGFDIASYVGSDAAVRVSLATGVLSGGHAAGDTLTSIEGVRGSGYSDVIEGNSSDNWLIGATGNDTLIGGAGGDKLDGGDGFDIASYVGNTAAVKINLATGAASGGHATGDTFVSIEGVRGSGYSDVIEGNGVSNSLIGATGNDTLIGGAGGDKLDGGAGNDVASYLGSNAAVNVNLATGVVSGGHAAGDTYISIEGVRGSGYADVIVGDGGANWLAGASGNDTLTGGAGSDNFVFLAALGSTNRDTITDFSHVDDRIYLDDAIFTAAGALGRISADAFYVVGVGTRDAEDRIIYDRATGVLQYDRDGTGAAAAVTFAVLTGSPDDVTYTDFYVV